MSEYETKRQASKTAIKKMERRIEALGLEMWRGLEDIKRFALESGMGSGAAADQMDDADERAREFGEALALMLSETKEDWEMAYGTRPGEAAL